MRLYPCKITSEYVLNIYQIFLSKAYEEYIKNGHLFISENDYVRLQYLANGNVDIRYENGIIICSANMNYIEVYDIDQEKLE